MATGGDGGCNGGPPIAADAALPGRLRDCGTGLERVFGKMDLGCRAGADVLVFVSERDGSLTTTRRKP